MSLSTAPERPRAAFGPPRTPPKTGAFVAGVAVSQIANNALHLAQPLLIAELSGSLALAAGVAAADTALHMAGTLLTGPVADRLGGKRLLVLSTLGRAAALAVVPAAMALGRLSLTVALASYAADALVRGGIDTGSHALPQQLAHDQVGLDRLNARYELAFDLGGVGGPLLLGLSFAARSHAAYALIPLGFAFGAVLFTFIPFPSRRPRSVGASESRWEAARLLRVRPALAFGCAALACLNLFPLRKLISSFFAKAVLHDKAAAGWAGAAFGLGGVAGALLYERYADRLTTRGWVALGALATLALGLALLPGSLAWLLAAAFGFSLLNVGARLALTKQVQAMTPQESAGRVAALWRFASNGVSVVLKAVMGAAFALKAGPAGAFAAVAGGLAVVAAVQAALSAGLRPVSRTV